MFFSRNTTPHHVLVAREDAIGDVILALPLCGLIKKYYPGCKVTFLGTAYTEGIAKTSIHVDEFMNYEEWQTKPSAEISALLNSKKIDTVIHLLHHKHVLKECRKAKIKIRIGGINKIQYWQYCNRLVAFSRQNSRLSEAQMNIKLLSPLHINEVPGRNEVYNYYGFSKIAKLDPLKRNLLDPEKFNLVIHPLSNKNGKEWGLHNFATLIKLTDAGRFKLFITGSIKERATLASWIQQFSNKVTDLTGLLEIDQLIAFIASADGLIASSTGPVHIAAATGINTLGLYPDTWTKRGERWGPIGKKADFLQCADEDMDTITASMVYEKISKWILSRSMREST